MGVLKKIQIVSIGIVIVGATVVTVVGIFREIPVELLLSMLLGLLAAFSIYQLTANISLDKKIETIQSIGASREVTQEDWYKELIPEVISADTEIQITHHSPLVPTVSGSGYRKKLWGKLVAKMGNKKVLLRWIVAIENLEKFDWVISLIEKYKTNDSFNIHCSMVDLEYPAPPQSIQIIDRKKLFVIDMSKGHYVVSEVGTGLISVDQQVIRQFQRYFDKYWDRGSKLKEGPIIYYNVIENLSSKLKRNRATKGSDDQNTSAT